jgi:hypothetical protein
MTFFAGSQPELLGGIPDGQFMVGPAHRVRISGHVGQDEARFARPRVPPYARALDIDPRVLLAYPAGANAWCCERVFGNRSESRP